MRIFASERNKKIELEKELKIQKSKKPQFLYKKESQFLFCSLQVARFLGGLVFLEILEILVQLR